MICLLECGLFGWIPFPMLRWRNPMLDSLQGDWKTSPYVVMIHCEMDTMCQDWVVCFIKRWFYCVPSQYWSPTLLTNNGKESATPHYSIRDVSLATYRGHAEVIMFSCRYLAGKGRGQKYLKVPKNHFFYFWTDRPKIITGKLKT